jgi:hypothetical protein
MNFRNSLRGVIENTSTRSCAGTDRIPVERRRDDGASDVLSAQCPKTWWLVKSHLPSPSETSVEFHVRVNEQPAFCCELKVLLLLHGVPDLEM